MSPETMRSADSDALRALLERRVIERGLCAAGAARHDLDDAIEALIAREVKVPVPGADECRRWYDAHPAAFIAGELAMVRHILFALTAGTPVEALRRKAEATLLELQREPERFGECARALSNCPSGAQGGALGQLSRGECVPEFERAIFGSDVTGVLPTLVNTRFGFHVVAVDRRIAGHRVPFEAVYAEVARRMSEQSWNRALAQYAQMLAGELGAATARQPTSPLVQ